MAKIEVEKTTIKVYKKHEHIVAGYHFNDYCPMCGEHLLVEKDATCYECSACHGELKNWDSQSLKFNFCPHCGKKFSNPVEFMPESDTIKR